MESEEKNEKFATIRQTIRRVILPLVQSIYDVDPPDVELFCFQFFESQLRKRESNEKVAADGNFKRIETFPDKNEADECIKKCEDDDVKIINSTTNIQGSASDPVLTREKCHGMSLRETSSWDITSNHPELDGRRRPLISNLSDAKYGVGDQSCYEELSAADPDVESERKAGDEYSFQKREDKIPANENTIPLDEEVQASNVLPSAPQYENDKRKLENIEIGFYNSENSDQEIEIVFEKNGSTVAKNEASLVSYSLSDNSFSDKSTEALNLSSKVLSPNSSFGFIPHETSVRQESPKPFESLKSSKDSDFEKGKIDLAGQLSETFQDLAQKFNAAETNLDVEFHKAEEISDVMQRRSLRAAFEEEDKLNFNIMKEDANTHEKSYNSSNVEIDSYIDVEENIDISSVRNMFENSCKAQREELSPIFSYVEKSEEDFETDQHESKSDSSKVQAVASEVNLNKDEFELHQIKNYSFLQQRNLSDDKNRTNVVNFGATVDEEWRKRWYEAHPYLDNSSNRLLQSPTRGNIRSQIYISAHNNPTMNPIGEAGDVPPDLFRYSSENNLTRNLRHFESSSRVERNVSFSPILEEQISHENPLTDEIQGRENSKETFNDIEKNLARTKASSSCSSNIPYAWRKMSKQQVRYLETEEQVVKQLLKSCGEEAVSKEKKSVEISKTTHTQALQDSVSKTIVDKQANKVIYDNDANNESEKTHNNELGDSEKKSYKDNYKDNADKKLHSPPLEKNGFFKADTSKGINLNISSINDKSVKHKALIDEDCDNFEREDNEVNEETKNTVSENQNDLKEEKYFNTFSTREEDKIINQNDEARNEDVCKKKTSTLTSHENSISEVKEAVQAYQRLDNTTKTEPGLDSAGGDFTTSNINENNEISYSPDYAGHNTSSSPSEITVEYVGEIIERMMQQDSLSDSFEGLNFSSYSDNDSSDMESEYSDVEDSNVYSEMFEP